MSTQARMPTVSWISSALARDGYFVLEGAIAPAVAIRLRNFVYGQLDLYRDVFHDATAVSLDDPTAVRRYVSELTAGDGRYQQLPADVRHLVRGEFPLDVRLSNQLLAVAHQQTLLDGLHEALAADALRMHYPPMVRFKTPGHRQVDVPLHQDCSYNAHLDHFMTAWVPLCEITDACGGVDVLVGSHTLGPLVHHEEVIWNNCIDEKTLRARGHRFDVRHVTMRLGDVLLFGPYTLHRSHPNTSDVTRCSIDYRFFPRAAATPKHCYDLMTQTVIAPTEAAA